VADLADRIADAVNLVAVRAAMMVKNSAADLRFAADQDRNKDRLASLIRALPTPGAEEAALPASGEWYVDAVGYGEAGFGIYRRGSVGAWALSQARKPLDEIVGLLNTSAAPRPAETPDWPTVSAKVVAAVKSYDPCAFNLIADIQRALMPLWPASPPAPSPETPDGVALIAAERRRQVEVEGWTLKHDDSHRYADLSVVAAALAVDGTDARVVDQQERVDEDGRDTWGLVAKFGYRGSKPNDVRRLAIAGALIAAELDRALRDEARSRPVVEAAKRAAPNPEPPSPETGEPHDERLPMETAPRDGTVIRVWSLEGECEVDVQWSTHYSIHGLGGCWQPADGFGQYGDLHLKGWQPIESVAEPPAGEPEPVALQPCPFCGRAMRPRWALWPSDGDVDGIMHAAPTDDCWQGEFTINTADKSVVDAWNRRAAPPPPPPAGPSDTAPLLDAMQKTLNVLDGKLSLDLDGVLVCRMLLRNALMAAPVAPPPAGDRELREAVRPFAEALEDFNSCESASGLIPDENWVAPWRRFDTLRFSHWRRLAAAPSRSPAPERGVSELLTAAKPFAEAIRRVDSDQDFVEDGPQADEEECDGYALGGAITFGQWRRLAVALHRASEGGERG
jgi:hypothetical protein